MTIPRFRLDRKRSSAQQLVGLWGPGPPTSTLLYDMSPGRPWHGAINPATGWYNDPVRGPCLHFDGAAAGEVVLGDPTWFESMERFSITFWVMILDDTQDADLITKGLHAAGEPFFFWFDNALNDHWQLQVTDDGADNAIVTSDFIPLIDTWYHVAITFQPEIARIYTDGVPDANSPFAMANVGGVAAAAWDWRIGNDRLQAKRATAYMQDVRFYLDRVLSPAHVAHVFNSTRYHPYADLMQRTTRRYVHRHRAEVG